MATHEGVVEAATDFGTLPEPPPDEFGTAPDVVALSPEGQIIIGEAKYGTTWRSPQAVDQLSRLRHWRYRGEPAWRLIVAASAGRVVDAIEAARSAGWDEDRLGFVEVALPEREALDEASIRVMPATPVEIDALRDALTEEQRTLLATGELIPVSVDAWASYANREFVSVPKRLGVVDREAFADDVERVIADAAASLEQQLDSLGVLPWELRSSTRVDVSRDLTVRLVRPHPDGGWEIRSPGNPRSSRFETQAAAERRAKDILSRLGGGELRVHNRAGQIRQQNTIARPDEAPPEP